MNVSILSAEIFAPDSIFDTENLNEFIYYLICWIIFLMIIINTLFKLLLNSLRAKPQFCQYILWSLFTERECKQRMGEERTKKRYYVNTRMVSCPYWDIDAKNVIVCFCCINKKDTIPSKTVTKILKFCAYAVRFVSIRFLFGFCFCTFWQRPVYPLRLRSLYNKSTEAINVDI